VSPTAAHCNTLQHAATHCSQIVCNSVTQSLSYAVIHYRTLQHNSTQCDTVQHTAAQCSHTVCNSIILPPHLLVALFCNACVNALCISFPLSFSLPRTLMHISFCGTQTHSQSLCRARVHVLFRSLAFSLSHICTRSRT